jgi:hypothetical protein
VEGTKRLVACNLALDIKSQTICTFCRLRFQTNYRPVGPPLSKVKLILALYSTQLQSYKMLNGDIGVEKGIGCF